MTLALLTGRLSNRWIRPPRWTILALYFYAGIQAAWGDFADDISFVVAMASVALALKVLLYWVVRWAIESRLIFVYFEGVRELETSVPGWGAPLDLFTSQVLQVLASEDD